MKRTSLLFAAAVLSLASFVSAPASAQSAHYCAAIAGGHIGANNSPEVERKFSECMHGKPAKPAANSNASMNTAPKVKKPRAPKVRQATTAKSS